MIHVTMLPSPGGRVTSYEPMPQGSCLYTISNPLATVVAELASTFCALLSVNTSKRNGVWNAAITESLLSVSCHCSVMRYLHRSGPRSPASESLVQPSPQMLLMLGYSACSTAGAVLMG